MGLQAIADHLAPRMTWKVAADAGRAAAPLSAKARIALDHAGFKQLDRSVTKDLARFNADALKKAPDLLKIKYERMAQNPFSFFRGSDDLFYHDMRRVEGKAMERGPKTILQGDLHMANFGAMAHADGKVFVGLNDFDEAFVGPANLDLKRFGTSIALAADEAGFKPSESRDFVRDFAETYHKSLERLADHPEKALKMKAPGEIRELVDGAASVDADKWLAKKLTKQGGKNVLTRSETVLSVSDRTASDVKRAFSQYRDSLPTSAARQLDGYQVSDVASAIAGTGSVGRARYRLLLEAEGKPSMILEFKEEIPSAIAPYVSGPKLLGSEADRFVSASRTMEGPMDRFLGTTTLPRRDALKSDSFVVRRLVPTKDALDPTMIGDAEEFGDLVKYYARAIAQGHANGSRLGLEGAAEVLESIGHKKRFTEEMVQYSGQYAQQVQRDFRAFKDALEKDPLLRRP